MKHLLLLGTGGTIACKRGENGLTPLLTGDELLSYVPDAKKFCEVETVQVLNIDSTNMHPKHWLKLAQVLEENYDDYDGFVICHGTDTMAYTAAAMSYLVQHSSKPIVITGAQKPIDLDVTDARTNLLDSRGNTWKKGAQQELQRLLQHQLPVPRRDPGRAYFILHRRQVAGPRECPLLPRDGQPGQPLKADPVHGLQPPRLYGRAL